MPHSFLRTGLLLLAVLFALGLAAQDRTLQINDLDVEIRILKTGDLEITENYTVEFFLEHQGIWRTIPRNFQYRHENGSVENRKLSIRDIEVPDWKFKTERSSGKVGIRIGEKGKYIDGVHNYTIRYKVSGAIVREEMMDVFYWNLLGNEWDIAINKVNFNIQLPENLALPQGNYAAYTGFRGDTTSAVFNYESGIFQGSSKEILGNGKEMTALIKFPANYFAFPGAAEKAMNDYGILLLFLPLVVVYYFVWDRFGKDKRLPVAVEYFPPEKLDPVQAGYLVDGKKDNCDITCLIPYWGAKGYLNMREEKKPGLFGKKEVTLTKMHELPQGLNPYEYTVFGGLFGGRSEVKIHDLKNKFYQTMIAAGTDLGKVIRQKGYYESRSERMRILAFIFFILLGIAGFIFLKEQLATAIIWGVISLAMAIMAYFQLRKLSPRGEELKQRILGFRQFMEKAEKPRLEILLKEDPSYFEKTLPFAVAFGLVKKWTSKFDGLYVPPPGWYHSTHNNFNANNISGFTDSFTRSMSSMSASMVSSPGSGGSGGGSAGGGAGGGGGGGW